MGISYHNLCIQKLSAGLTISNFIKGIGLYSYEDYLLEFVNHSPFFLNKSNGNIYVHPTDESHGEHDCISEDYQIDFKLLTSQSSLQGQSLFSPQIYYENGCTRYCTSRKTSKDADYKPIKTTRIFAALRKLSATDLIRIRSNENNATKMDQDICHLLKIFETNKNILAFFPFNFYFEEPADFEKGLDVIMKAMNSDFHEALLYRRKHCPLKDTFISFLYKNQIILTEWKFGELQLIETLSIENSPLFMRILDLTDDVFSGGGLK